MNKIETKILNCSAVREAEKTWSLQQGLHSGDI